MKNGLEFLKRDAVYAARELIGWKLYVKDNGAKIGGTIVETEAYSQDDAASHSYRGKTARSATMFGPAGYVYVYFAYGMHWCVNIVTGPKGRGEAVLIRSILPDAGLNEIKKRRLNAPTHELTNGPAKLCQALGITGADNGVKIGDGKFLLEPPTKKFKILATKRIGIKKDVDRPWRFVGI